jgi:hypothetical protein
VSTSGGVTNVVSIQADPESNEKEARATQGLAGTLSQGRNPTGQRCTVMNRIGKAEIANLGLTWKDKKSNGRYRSLPPNDGREMKHRQAMRRLKTRFASVHAPKWRMLRAAS